MRSVTDALRDATRQADAELTPEARVERAFRLGDDDLVAFASANAMSLDEARRVLMRNRQRGRRVSGCIQRLTS